MTDFRRYGLIGWPLHYSLSPVLHQAALQSFGWEGEYSMFPLPPLPGGKSEMDILINQLRSMELQGVNVTIPHKRSFLPFLDELTPAARAVGAVNTLYFTGEKLVGENTDVPGFIGDLNAHLPSALGDNALVLGAGGAARAVVYALINYGWQVYVSARNPDQAQELANSFAHLIPSPVAFTLPLHDIAISLIGVQIRLVVNATPLGMSPHSSESPWPADLPLPEKCFVYDLVYEPDLTPLMQQAKKQGLACSNGIRMLVKQAALSFILWNDLPSNTLAGIETSMHQAISHMVEL